jgi:hypothetical protein
LTESADLTAIPPGMVAATVRAGMELAAGKAALTDAPARVAMLVNAGGTWVGAGSLSTDSCGQAFAGGPPANLRAGPEAPGPGYSTGEVASIARESWNRSMTIAALF